MEGIAVPCTEKTRLMKDIITVLIAAMMIIYILSLGTIELIHIIINIIE
jgi:hypothetical protein